MKCSTNSTLLLSLYRKRAELIHKSENRLNLDIRTELEKRIKLLSEDIDFLTEVLEEI